MTAKLKSYNFWIRMVSVLLLFVRIVGNEFGFEIDSVLLMDIATAFAGVLVVLGVIQAPVSGSSQVVLGENNSKVQSEISDKKGKTNYQGGSMSEEQENNVSLGEIAKEIYEKTQAEVFGGLCNAVEDERAQGETSVKGTESCGVTTISSSAIKDIAKLEKQIMENVDSTSDNFGNCDFENKESEIDKTETAEMGQEDFVAVEEFLNESLEAEDGVGQETVVSSGVVEAETEAGESIAEQFDLPEEIEEVSGVSAEILVATEEQVCVQSVENKAEETQAIAKIKEKLKSLIVSNLDSIIDEVLC